MCGCIVSGSSVKELMMNCHINWFHLLSGTGCTNQTEILIDLVGPDVQSNSVPQQQLQTSSASIPADLLWGSADHPSSSHNPPSAAFSLLDEELLSLGKKKKVGSRQYHVHQQIL